MTIRSDLVCLLNRFDRVGISVGGAGNDALSGQTTKSFAALRRCRPACRPPTAYLLVHSFLTHLFSLSLSQPNIHISLHHILI